MYIFLIIITVVIIISVYYMLKGGKGVACLMYHNVFSEISDGIISKDEFEKHMEHIKEMKTFKMEELESIDYKLPENAILVTFDDGYRNSYTNAFPILKKYNIKATIFLNTKYIGTDMSYLNWNEIQEMYESGLIDFQLHTHTHTPVIRKPQIKGFFQEDEGEFVKREYFSIFNLNDGEKDFRNFNFTGLPVFKIRSGIALRGMRIREDFLKKYEKIVKNSKFQSLSIKERKKYLNRLFFQNKSEFFQEYSEEDFNRRVEFEIGENRRIIEEKLNKKAEYLAYPWGHGYEGDIKVLENLGIKGFIFTKEGKNKTDFNIKKIVRINGDKIKKYDDFLKKIKSDYIQSMKKLKKYIKKYYILIILNMLLSMISSTVSVSPIVLVKRLFDKGIIGNNEKDILYAAGAMIVLAVAGAFLIYWNTVFSTKISSSIYKDVIDDLYVKLQSLDMGYFSRIKIGELMTKVLTDPNNINNIIIESFNLFSEVFKATVCLGIALYMDWKLTMGVLVVAPILMVTVRKYSRKLKSAGKARQEAAGTLNSKLQETLSGIRVIKAFATENQEIRDFKRKSIDLKRYVLKSSRYNAKSSAISEAVNYIMVAILLMFGGYRVLRGHNFTPGDFITIVGAISSMYTPVKRAISRFNDINSNIPSIDRVFEILDEVPDIINKPDCIKFEEFKRDIVFENVNFSYKDNDEKILKNINFKAEKGETIALVGNSGGGKSTLVNLIPRFFDVSRGSLKIDGIDIRDYDIKSLRKAIGIVPQETFLFSGTILTNIKYSRQDATFEEVVKAAKQANAHEFIENLSDGYDTEIGERGVKLSGGQKQRIAIARAILENPQILILDEATSALDNESEKLVQDALEKLMEGKTTFVIAHRLTTIENSNKIVVVQKGEIKEIGSHSELLNKNGIYKALYNKNFDTSNKS